MQGVTTLGRKANTQPVLNVLGTARTAALQASTRVCAAQGATVLWALLQALPGNRSSQGTMSTWDPSQQC